MNSAKRSASASQATISSPNVPVVNIAQALNPEKMDLAQQAFEKNKSENVQSLLSDVIAIQRCVEDYRKGEVAEGQFKRILKLTLDLKSISAMYGYPLATEIARLLFVLIEKQQEAGLSDDKTLRSITLYVSALRQVFEQNPNSEQVESNLLLAAFGELNNVLQSHSLSGSVDPLSQ